MENQQPKPNMSNVDTEQFIKIRQRAMDQAIEYVSKRDKLADILDLLAVANIFTGWTLTDDLILPNVYRDSLKEGQAHE